MKKQILIIVFTLSITLIKAQIPNFSFENWNNMGNYENPLQWGTMNNTSASIGIFTATKATPGNPGAAFLKLTSKTTPSGVLNGIAVSGELDSITMQPKSGFAFNMRPASFTGKWQHMIYGSSQGSISATLTRWDSSMGMRVIVATANQTLSGMAMSWANFSINFNYQDGNNPDTCIIFMKASESAPTNLDYLWVDNLGFSGTVTGINGIAPFLNNISVFPNPTSNILSIDLDMKLPLQTTIEMFDCHGRVVIEKKIGLISKLNTVTLDLADVASGNYYIKISTELGAERKSIIVERK